MQPDSDRQKGKAEPFVAGKKAAFPPKGRKSSSKKPKESIAPLFQRPMCPPSKPNQSTKYHSAGFWDALSSISLSHRALQELDRRNSTYTSQPIPVLKPIEGDIRRFARHGGPDISDIQGYPEPSDLSSTATMGRKRKSSKGVSKPSGTNPNTKSSDTKNPRKSSAYDINFQRLLAERYVDPPSYDDKPANVEQRETRMRVPRRSLSPTTFTNEDHGSFIRTWQKATGEPRVMQDVFIAIRGTNKYPSASDRPCGNWAPLLSQLSPDADLVTAKPDYCEGHNQDARDAQIRRILNTYIVPSSCSDVPFLLNFFLEAKGDDGTMAVAKRQATYDGALGARGMHCLQTYGVEAIFDNNAYTVSAVFMNGTLIIYAHYLTRPEESGQCPRYHMPMMMMYAIAGSAEEFRKGVTAFRNLSDLAHDFRERFLQDANRRLAAIREAPT